MDFHNLDKLRKGDKVAIVSPSWIAPAVFPEVHELGLARLRDKFSLVPVELPHARTGSASLQDRISDLVEAFQNPAYKAVISTTGGDIQVEYVKHLPTEPFRRHPKPFFGYSDNTHLSNFLFLQGVPSYYGGSIYTEFGMNGAMDPLTEKYLRIALFEGGTHSLEASSEFSDEDLSWENPALLNQRRRYQTNAGWFWNGSTDAYGVSWGGCLESVDELLRHNIQIPTLDQFEQVVLFLETCEETPPAYFVARVLRGLGERGVLPRVRAVLMGRPKAWSFSNPRLDAEKELYVKEQRDTVVSMIRKYNQTAPIVQNVDFGHTQPTVTLPYGMPVSVSPARGSIEVKY
jgi:muramoyltetrapeptide carboxypeptidase LdcA involved in peptidoglycan recycling